MNEEIHQNSIPNQLCFVLNATEAQHLYNIELQKTEIDLFKTNLEFTGTISIIRIDII
jgi:hypothetical protein